MIYYLDSVGLIASATNRFLLHQKMPTPWQIEIWDRLLIPISRILDRVIGYRFGKSIVAVWHKQ